MKRTVKRTLCSLLAVCMLMSLFCAFASAAEQTSAYLDDYSVNVTAKSGGRIAVTLNISPVGSMDKVGATSVHIYESTDNEAFEWAASYYEEDYPELMGSGTIYLDSPVTYYGTVGRYYMAVAYVYAGDETGSDWAMCESSSVRARS